MCKISVIMGIYNCADTLPDAINSILNQTYTDWELILCDDGSTDETYAVAREYQKQWPGKIKLIQNETNFGLNATLNHCLQMAEGKYIARMDADDLCSPERFAAELAVLENEPEVAIVSTDMEFFDETGVWGVIRHPEYPDRKDFLAGSPFCHAACMMRKEALDAVGGYSVSKWLLRVEDYHLWLKMYKVGYKGKNIHTALYQMRDDREAYARRKFAYRINEAYVKILVVRDLKLPFVYVVCALKPILVGLLPGPIYKFLHKKKLQNR